ncbi:MAG: carbon-nitrogen hydrolase family protein [Anaerolineae bacterium]
MSELAIALLQMTSHGADRQANLEKGERFCRRTAAMGADLALFPEMWNIGYAGYDADAPGAREAWRALAVPRDGAFVRHFRALAAELEMAIALTYLEAWPGGPRDSVSLIDRHGELRLTYAKVHTCVFDTPEVDMTPGDDFCVAELDTAQDEVTIGAMICYDREFPESARVLMLKGAEIILTPNACTLERHRLAQFRTRAYENMVGLAMTNYAAPQENGHSIAVDAVAFDEKGRSVDNLIVEAGPAEDVYLAHFDLARLRAYRAREAWGDSFRRPGCYRRLTGIEVTPPFQRADAYGDPFTGERR